MSRLTLRHAETIQDTHLQITHTATHATQISCSRGPTLLLASSGLLLAGMESQTREGNAKDLPHRESSGTKARKVHVAGSFLRSYTEIQNARQERLKAFLASYYVANFMVAVVLLDAYSTCTDIDARAAGSPPPQFFLVISDVCLVLYSLEILGMVLVFGVSHLSDWMIMVDAIIIACGWAEKVLASVGTGGGIGFRTAVLRAMRLVRIFRIMRVLKRIRPLRELHKLVMMMATCVRTLLWSFLLCFVVMTVWGMLMVELVNPALQDFF